MATDVFPAIPADDYTFTLSRRRDSGAVMVLIVLGVWVCGMAIGILSSNHRPQALVFVSIWVIIYVSLFARLTRPLGARPVAVSLSAQGMRVVWRDRLVEHPWAALTWGDRPFGGMEIADGAGWTGVTLDLLAPWERPRFVEAFLARMVLPGAETEAAELAAGGVITASAARWRPFVGMTALALLTLAMPFVLPRWGRPIEADGQPWFWVLYAAVIAGRGVYDLCRASTRTVRFTPEDLWEQVGAGRNRLLDYPLIDSIVCGAKGRRQQLRVWSGKRMITLYAEDGAFSGALHLLRERATNARWDMRS